MPTTKLTLSADSELIQRAKKLASKKGTSLSAMFNRYIRSVVLQEEHSDVPGPLTSQALGLVQLPEGRTNSELLEEALVKRHQN